MGCLQNNGKAGCPMFKRRGKKELQITKTKNLEAKKIKLVYDTYDGSPTLCQSVPKTRSK